VLHLRRQERQQLLLHLVPAKQQKGLLCLACLACGFMLKTTCMICKQARTGCPPSHLQAEQHPLFACTRTHTGRSWQRSSPTHTGHINAQLPHRPHMCCPPWNIYMCCSSPAQQAVQQPHAAGCGWQNSA
jgi:hypothetical protein